MFPYLFLCIYTHIEMYAFVFSYYLHGNFLLIPFFQFAFFIQQQVGEVVPCWLRSGFLGNRSRNGDQCVGG